MHKFWVVMSQVYKKNARSGSWIFLVLSPLFFLAIAFGIVFYISKTQAPAQVAVVSDVSVVRQALSKQSTDDLQFKPYSSAQKANQALNKEDIDGILTVNAKDDFKSHYVARDNGQTVETSTLVAALSGLKLSSTAAAMKLTPAQVKALTAPPTVTSKTVAIEDGKQVAKSNTAQLMNHGLALVSMVLILMVTMVYGSILAQEIATEKGSRIMEILCQCHDAILWQVGGYFRLVADTTGYLRDCRCYRLAIFEKSNNGCRLVKAGGSVDTSFWDNRHDCAFLYHRHTHLFGLGCINRLACF